MTTPVIAADEEMFRKWVEAPKMGRSLRDYRRLARVSDLRDEDDLVLSLLPLSEPTVQMLDLKAVMIVWPPMKRRKSFVSAHGMDQNCWRPGIHGKTVWRGPGGKLPYEVL